MSKFGTFKAYPAGGLRLAEAVLLTVWRSLPRHQDDLVLVGGLALRYLTTPDKPDGLPGVVTLDVDFGVSLAAGEGMYGTIASRLAGLDFKGVDNRFVRGVDGIRIYVDFLTEDPPAFTGWRTVDDVVASVIPGTNRALARRRMITVCGRDLFGVGQVCPLAAADIGPWLVPKLNAFGGPTGRRSPKDAAGVLLSVTDLSTDRKRRSLPFKPSRSTATARISPPLRRCALISPNPVATARRGRRRFSRMTRTKATVFARTPPPWEEPCWRCDATIPPRTVRVPERRGSHSTKS